MLGEQIGSQAASTIEESHSDIPLCPVCELPAHASETDDFDCHAECQPFAHVALVYAPDVSGLAFVHADGTRCCTTLEGQIGGPYAADLAIVLWPDRLPHRCLASMWEPLREVIARLEAERDARQVVELLDGVA